VVNSYANEFGRCLRYRFHTERLQLKTLLSLNLAGATVLDIGANKGIYSYWLARAVGPSGAVVSFEPQPEMAQYISDRKRTFKLENVRVVNTALSKEAGTATLTRRCIGDGSASLEPSRMQTDRIEVPLATLDSMHMPDQRFIKCDVEGHELNVFSGAEQTIKKSRPVIQFEAVPAEASDLFGYFESLGYSGVMFLGDRYLPCPMAIQMTSSITSSGQAATEIFSFFRRRRLALQYQLRWHSISRREKLFRRPRVRLDLLCRRHERLSGRSPGQRKAGGGRGGHLRMLSNGQGGYLHVEGWLVPRRNPFGLYLYLLDVDAAAREFEQTKPWGM